MKRTRIVVAEERYLQVEFTSAFFRFVDDVEFFFDEGTKAIHLRSASARDIQITGGGVLP